MVRGVGRGQNLKAKPIENKVAELCGNCTKNRLVIDNKGNISPCVFSKWIKVGNFLVETDLKSLFQSDDYLVFDGELKKLMQKNKLNCYPDGDDKGCQPDYNCSPWDFPAEDKLNCYPDGDDRGCQPDFNCSPWDYPADCPPDGGDPCMPD